MQKNMKMSQDGHTTKINKGFLRLPEVLKIFPVSKSTWWAGVAAKKYPQPVKLSMRTTAWRVQDILDLIKEREEA